MPLAWVFLLGFLSSVLLLVAIFFVFFSYETGRSTERLSLDKMFELIRNTVTAAAAVGVGVTLFFSYRKQKTAEGTHLLGIKAQTNAANALALAADQYQLERDRRTDQQIKDLRERFSQAAERLGSGSFALVVAGVHSLETLADEWHDLKMDRDRQICINLLCSFARNPVADDPVNRSARHLIVETIFAHLTPEAPAEHYWDAVIPLKSASPPQISNIRIDGATVDISGWVPSSDFEGVIYRINLEDGSLLLHDVNLERESIFVNDCTFSGGTVSISLEDSPYAPISYTGVITFQRCNFTGTKLAFPEGTNGSMLMNFVDCAFKSSVLNPSADSCPGELMFDNCAFDADIFDEASNSWQGTSPYTNIRLHGDNKGPHVPKLRPGQTVTRVSVP